MHYARTSILGFRMTTITSKPGGFFWETPNLNAQEALEVLAGRQETDSANRTPALIASVVEDYNFFADLPHEAKAEIIQLVARNNTVTTQSAFKHLVECLKAAEEGD